MGHLCEEGLHVAIGGLHCDSHIVRSCVIILTLSLKIEI